MLVSVTNKLKFEVHGLHDQWASSRPKLRSCRSQTQHGSRCSNAHLPIARHPIFLLMREALPTSGRAQRLGTTVKRNISSNAKMRAIASQSNMTTISRRGHSAQRRLHKYQLLAKQSAWDTLPSHTRHPMCLSLLWSGGRQSMWRFPSRSTCSIGKIVLTAKNMVICHFSKGCNLSSAPTISLTFHAKRL